MSKPTPGDERTATPLLVGESNPYSRDPKDALLPWPRGAAGDRLRRVLGMTDRDYLRAFQRCNLVEFGLRWSLPEARERAAELRALGRPLVLLGAKVAEAFGVEFDPVEVVDGCLVLPHPSGRNRLWNQVRESDVRAAVEAFLAGRRKTTAADRRAAGPLHPNAAAAVAEKRTTSRRKKRATR